MYGKDYNRFLAEAVKKSPELVTNKDGIYKLKYDATQVVFNKRGEFLFLVKPRGGDVGLFARCNSTQNLGSYEDLDEEPEKRLLFERVYDNKPYDIIDKEGNSITVTPPEMFGSFA